eukprot:Blabericola_migrator_1__12059@NODE_741_length_6682_cov_71_114588_g531_i0_p3_GENE_NODE_741_length_6682_cov_71_114588_g531_i0NODE_741_length_6682_cov_71_114588_g531_i0_p3_ORF_typecomplete_len323_score27_46HisKA_4TM/PF16926_5/0_46HisKA_4TM/PF16926_5/1_5e03SUR7/PF06687_12/1_4e03SUR7/PF06687_12/0_075_NODE_741_length_6682_cov_71_114588_g531_i040345002
MLNSWTLDATSYWAAMHERTCVSSRCSSRARASTFIADSDIARPETQFLSVKLEQSARQGCFGWSWLPIFGRSSPKLRLSPTPRPSIDDSQVLTPSWRQTIFHPSKLPKTLLQMVAGRAWMSARTQITLFPLRFVNHDCEAKFVRRCQHLNGYPSRFAAFTFAFTHLTLFVAGLVMEHNDLWARSSPTIGYTWLLGSEISFFVSSMLIVIAHIKSLNKYNVFAYYIVSGGSSCVFAICGAVTFCHLDSKKISQEDDYDYLAYKMLVDCFITALCLMAVFTIDMALNTLTRQSIWFHIVSYGSFATERGAQIRYMGKQITVVV